jgi:mercuric ion transport protein
MINDANQIEPPPTARGAGLLTVAGIAAAFGAASCCALPILLTTAGLSAAWLGGFAAIAAPFRIVLLWAGLFSLIGGAILLFRQQRAAMTCGPNGTCTPRWVRGVLLVGLVCGAVLLWLGYVYV